ncbi:MAG: class I SAM-dependent methyltransferase [Rhodopseudomonas palustris]|nr:class I SAM-dependent methyltransferase [Rhodopseudomonas palustris]
MFGARAERLSGGVLRPFARQAARALSVDSDGEGRNGVFLARRGLSVLSVDYAPAAQRKAQQLAKARGVTLETQEAGLFTWQWPGGFDVVVGIFFQFAEPEQRAAVRAYPPGTGSPAGSC